MDTGAQDTSTPKEKRPVQRSAQLTTDLTVSIKAESQYTSFSELSAKRHIRLLRLNKNNFTSFKGLKNFPNLRVVELKDNPVDFSTMSILVAFRSNSLRTINGEAVSDEDFKRSFEHSGLVTYALRNGMNPNLAEDPEEALKDALAFFNQPEEPIYSYDAETQTITINAQADLYSWFVLDDEFTWRPLDSFGSTCVNPLNNPVKCEMKCTNLNSIKTVNIEENEDTNQTSTTTPSKQTTKTGRTPRKSPTPNKTNKKETTQIMNKASVQTILIPEVDHQYHIYAELSGDAVEGSIVTVKAPLTSKIEWKHLEDEQTVQVDTLVLPLSSQDVGHVVVCDITPGSNLPTTRLATTPVKPGEFRFKSLRLQGQLVENDEIEFEISTKGTKAQFKGVRVLRSARHGDWENIDFLSQPPLKYRLKVEDIGCVIRAVCITEGGGPPLMLTSSERVQPSAPHFVSANIAGSLKVGMPVFAIAQYEGGVQGNCKYEWSIGQSKLRPVVIPSLKDVGKQVSCKLTPIRSDGSIGQPLIVSIPGTIEPNDDGKPLVERYLQFHKKTRTGKLQMSFVEKPDSEQLFVIHEGDQLIISTVCDWVVVDSDGPHGVGTSKVFTAMNEHIKSIVVVFNDDFFAIVGVVEAANPSAKDVTITCDKTSAFLTANYSYAGGKEGRSIIQWNRIKEGRETVAAFGKSHHIGISDLDALYKAVVIPVSLDGKRGQPASSESFKVDRECIASDDKPGLEMVAPDEIIQDQPIIVFDTPKPEPCPGLSRVLVSERLTQRSRTVWLYKNRIINEGSSYTPTVDDIGKELTVQIRDRLREDKKSPAVLCEITLGAVQSQDPSVSNVHLIIEDVGSGRRRVTVSANFYGGIEEDSLIIWQAQRPEDTEPRELTRTTSKWVEIDSTFEGALIGIVYCPRNTENGPNEYGKSVSSEMIEVPISPRDPIIEILQASFQPDESYTHLKCIAQTKGPGTLRYQWGYVVDSEQQFNDEETNVHTIIEDDFECDLFCLIQPIGPKTADYPEGQIGEEAIVTYSPEQIKELYKPKIMGCQIRPVKNTNTLQIMQGDKLEPFLDYQGPPITKKKICWEREENPNAEDEETRWKILMKSEQYTATRSDIGKFIRVKIIVEASSDVLAQPVLSQVFHSEPVLVAKSNPTLVRLASSIRRAKKAQFDAKLPMGEKVSVLIDNTMFVMKNGNNVLLKSQLSQLKYEIVDGSVDTVLLKARHGYNTELTFANMKMKGGTEFTPTQTRDLFVETLDCFLQ